MIFNPKNKLSATERFKLTNQIDTITQIDSATYENRVLIVSNKIHPDDLSRLGLVQNWYWNSKKNRLEIWLLATSAITKVVNDAGEFLYFSPYSYRRTDD